MSSYQHKLDKFKGNNHSNADCKIEDDFLTCSCNSKNENQYSIADLQGNVVSKGKFVGKVKVNLDQLSEGIYEIVIFNTEGKKSFPFKVEPKK